MISRCRKPGDNDVWCGSRLPGFVIRTRIIGLEYRGSILCPLTLGHEVAGVIEAIGGNVRQFRIGQRVCLHYMATCGACDWCAKQNEQFCETGAMIGKSRDGGYAEFIVIPARSVFKLPDEIPFEHGAIMMCSSATSLHALNKARMKPGESVAIFGAGGLGLSAIQLAKALGAHEVFAVDIQPNKLDLARSLGPCRSTPGPTIR